MPVARSRFGLALVLSVASLWASPSSFASHVVGNGGGFGELLFAEAFVRMPTQVGLCAADASCALDDDDERLLAAVGAQTTTPPPLTFFTGTDPLVEARACVTTRPPEAGDAPGTRRYDRRCLYDVGADGTPLRKSFASLFERAFLFAVEASGNDASLAASRDLASRASARLLDETEEVSMGHRDVVLPGPLQPRMLALRHERLFVVAADIVVDVTSDAIPRTLVAERCGSDANALAAPPRFKNLGVEGESGTRRDLRIAVGVDIAFRCTRAPSRTEKAALRLTLTFDTKVALAGIHLDTDGGESAPDRGHPRFSRNAAEDAAALARAKQNVALAHHHAATFARACLATACASAPSARYLAAVVRGLDAPPFDPSRITPSLAFANEKTHPGLFALDGLDRSAVLVGQRVYVNEAMLVRARQGEPAEEIAFEEALGLYLHELAHHVLFDPADHGKLDVLAAEMARFAAARKQTLRFDADDAAVFAEGQELELTFHSAHVNSHPAEVLATETLPKGTTIGTWRRGGRQVPLPFSLPSFSCPGVSQGDFNVFAGVPVSLFLPYIVKTGVAEDAQSVRIALRLPKANAVCFDAFRMAAVGFSGFSGTLTLSVPKDPDGGWGGDPQTSLDLKAPPDCHLAGTPDRIQPRLPAGIRTLTCLPEGGLLP